MSEDLKNKIILLLDWFNKELEQNLFSFREEDYSIILAEKIIITYPVKLLDSSLKLLKNYIIPNELKGKNGIGFQVSNEKMIYILKLCGNRTDYYDKMQLLNKK